MSVKGVLRGTTLEHTADGYVVTEVWRVDGLTGDARGQQYAAEHTAGVPQEGDAHSHVPNIYASNIAAEHITQTAVQLTITFQPRTGSSGSAPSEADPGILEVGTALVQTTTELDNEGNQITLSHTYTTGEKAGTTDPQGGSVEVQVPQGIVRITRREPTSPLTKSLQFTGTVNKFAWNGYPARTWLCLPIVGRTGDGGESYEVTYEFTYRSITWDSRPVYIDPDTGRRPPDLVEGEGLKTVPVYPESDFGPLGIAF